ncbi:MAG TPA: hypothetical protein ENN73_03315, partial [Firmicutes bacterium]|nr:hypothetical protein [Bacillota bacterium]
MKKLILLIMIAVILMFIMSCTKVKRDNPYDPDSEDFDPNLYEVTLKGYVYRGWSEIPLPDVKIEIDNKIIFTDNNGYYEIKLKHGEYVIHFSKQGWQPLNYSIKVGANKNQLVRREDVAMFIWRENWTNYSNGALPHDPWFYEVYFSTVPNWAQARVWHGPDDNNFLQLTVNDNAEGMANAKTWTTLPESADICYIVSVVAVFHPGKEINTDIRIAIMEEAMLEFAAIYWGKTTRSVFYYSLPAEAELNVQEPFSMADQVLCFTFALHPDNTQFLDLNIYL